MFSNFLDAFLRPLHIALAWVIPLSWRTRLNLTAHWSLVTSRSNMLAPSDIKVIPAMTPHPILRVERVIQSRHQVSVPSPRAGQEPRPLQESSRTRCMVLILVKNDFAACRITTSRGIARLHKPLNGKSTLPPHFLRSNPEQHQQQEGASPSNNARTRPQQQQHAGTDAVAACLPDMTGLTSAVASEGFTLIYRSSAGGMPLCSTVVVAPDTLHRSGRRPSCC